MLLCGSVLAAPAPEKLNGKLLKVDFSSALVSDVVQGKAGEWKPTSAAPILVQFPADEGQRFTIQRNEPSSGEEDTCPPLVVSYAPQGEMAVLMVTGHSLFLVLTLNFDTPDSGTASLSMTVNERDRLARDADFRLLPATSSGGRMELPCD